MITVIEGHEVTTMDHPVSSKAEPGTASAVNEPQDASNDDSGLSQEQRETLSGEVGDSKPHGNFFQRLWQSVSDWFSGLFS